MTAYFKDFTAPIKIDKKFFVHSPCFWCNSVKLRQNVNDDVAGFVQFIALAPSKVFNKTNIPSYVNAYLAYL